MGIVLLGLAAGCTSGGASNQASTSATASLEASYKLALRCASFMSARGEKLAPTILPERRGQLFAPANLMQGMAMFAAKELGKTKQQFAEDGAAISHDAEIQREADRQVAMESSEHWHDKTATEQQCEDAMTLKSAAS